MPDVWWQEVRSVSYVVEIVRSHDQVLNYTPETWPGVLKIVSVFGGKFAVERIRVLRRSCDCGRPARRMPCRCTCSRCASRNLRWEPWGSYLDKDLVCQDCRHLQDTWDC